MKKNKSQMIEGEVEDFYRLVSSPLMLPTLWYRTPVAMHYKMNAPRETKQILADMANVSSEDRILDMGCGHGDSLLWLTRHFSCSVYGVAICEEEVRKANHFLKKAEVEKQSKAFREDMTATHFDDDFFSVVWAIESMCHVDNKKKFIQEAYRVLIPGGRMIIADFFLTRALQNREEITLYEQCKEGFLAPSLQTKNEFLDMLHAEGFSRVRYDDYSQMITSEVRHREIVGWFNIFFVLPLTFIRLLPKIFLRNTRGGIVQGKLFRHNILSYGIIYAEK